MNKVVSKWLLQRVSAALLVPILVWFLFKFDDLMMFNYSEAIYFLNNKFHLLLLSLMFLLIFTHMRLGMSEIFEDYIHQEKVKKLLNTFILIISVIIPVAAIVSMVILGL
ncbi:MAG: succinate dehydrogenase, hydrophobic membrane anchor protein [Pelagibacteraceae bacterium]